MKTLSELVPLRALRHGYVRAFYRVWEAEHVPHAPDPDDVYTNGLEWSQRPVSTEDADRLLALHDAAVEKELDFTQILESNLHLR